MAFQALIQLFQASSQPIQAPNWLSGLTSALLDLNSAQTDGRMDEQTDERKSPCVLQDFVPFGAAALLSLTPFHDHAKQGKRVSLVDQLSLSLLLLTVTRLTRPFPSL